MRRFESLRSQIQAINSTFRGKWESFLYDAELLKIEKIADEYIVEGLTFKTKEDALAFVDRLAQKGADAFIEELEKEAERLWPSDNE